MKSQLVGFLKQATNWREFFIFSTQRHRMLIS